LAFEKRRLTAVSAVDLDPVLPGAVARLAGDAGNRLQPARFLLHRVVARRAQAFRSDSPNAHFLADLVCLGVARHLTERLEVMRGFPRLDLLLVAFGASIRTDDLSRVGRDCAVRGKAEACRQAAETKH